jgi:multiple sugar transport system permease protein
MSNYKEFSIIKVVKYTGIVVLVLITVFPFYWIIRTSLTTSSRIYVDAGKFLPPRPTLMNYARVLGMVDAETAIANGGTGQSVNFIINLWNSLIVSIITTVCQVFFSAMAAYSFARLKFTGKSILFKLILSAMMIPGIVMTIPNFILIKNAGLVNTYAGIVAPAILMTPFAVFFLHQFYIGINKELEEAAYLDGAGQYRTFLTIILPISQTGIVTLGVTTFINTWNDYMWPMIVGKKEELRTLTVALGIFRSQVPQGQPDWSGLMAGTVLAIIPALIIFSFFGKKIINSIGFTGFR